MLDTVAASHLPLYGYHRQTMPNLERLAAQSTVYSRCYAPACWTIPSHASIFTGLYPSQHGAHEGNFLLSDNCQHLIPALKMGGYATYGMSSNGLVVPESGLCPGFDFFQDFSAGFTKWVTWIDHEPAFPTHAVSDFVCSLAKALTFEEKASFLLKSFLKRKNFSEALGTIVKQGSFRAKTWLTEVKQSRPSESSVRVFREIITKTAMNTDKPLFLFINFIDAHAPYRPPWKWRRYSRLPDRQYMSLREFHSLQDKARRDKLLAMYRNLYDDGLSYLDFIINKIWNILKGSSIVDDTVFIITSDHGEQFGHNDSYEHCLSLYNEVIKVPLIIRYPESIRTKGIDNRLVSLNDIFATILDLAYDPRPRPQSALSLLSSSTREYTVSQIVVPGFWQKELQAKKAAYLARGRRYSPPGIALITAADRKIIENQDGGLEIYELQKDAEESCNLFGELSPEGRDLCRDLLAIGKAETAYPANP